MLKSTSGLVEQGQWTIISIRDEHRRVHRLEDRPGVFALPSEKWWRGGEKPLRDSMRQKIYDSETDAREALSGRVFEDLGQVSRYLRDTMETDWFQRRWPLFREVRIRYSPQTRGANAGVDLRQKHDPFGMIPISGNIVAGPWALPREAVWLHELAHCVIPPRHYHDRLWVRTFLELLRLRMGREAHDALRGSLKERNVKWNPVRSTNFSEEHKARLAACRPAMQKVC